MAFQVPIRTERICPCPFEDPSVPPHRRCWGIKAAAAPYTNAAGSVWSAWALLWNHDKNSSKLATLKHKENNNRKSPSVQKGMFQAPFSYGERRAGGREQGDLKRAGPLPRQLWILWWRDLILSLWFRGARKLIEYSDLPPVFLVAWPRCCVVPLHQTAPNLHKSQPCKSPHSTSSPLLSPPTPHRPVSFSSPIDRKP